MSYERSTKGLRKVYAGLTPVSFIVLRKVYEGLRKALRLSRLLSYERSTKVYERPYACLVYCLTKGLQKVSRKALRLSRSLSYERSTKGLTKGLTPGLKINLLRRLNDEH